MTRAWRGPVADLTIPKLLGAVFEIERKCSEDDPFTLDWPDDVAGQGRCIRHLAEIAVNAALPYEMQTWAFGKLEEIVRDYQEKGELGSVPPEMLSWYFGVAAGWFEPPKRKRGRPGGQFALRDRMIVALVRWLRHRGETREAAMKEVRKAACVSKDTVKTVLRRDTWSCVGNAARPAKRTLRAWKRWGRLLASRRERSGQSSGGVKKPSKSQAFTHPVFPWKWRGFVAPFWKGDQHRPRVARGARGRSGRRTRLGGSLAA